MLRGIRQCDVTAGREAGREQEEHQQEPRTIYYRPRPTPSQRVCKMKHG